MGTRPLPRPRTGTRQATRHPPAATAGTGAPTRAGTWSTCDSSHYSASATDRPPMTPLGGVGGSARRGARVVGKRICCINGCPNDTNTRRCPQHQREHEQARGTKTQRGYGSTTHQTPIGEMTYDHCRREYQRRMNRGIPMECWRCGDPIDPEHWSLGHDDDDRSVIRGPECPHCNYATRSR